MSLFLELAQVSLGTRDRLSRTPSAAEWSDMYLQAQKQSIVGVLMDGLEHLPQEQLPSKELLLQWIGDAQLIEHHNTLHDTVLRKTYQCLKEGNIPVAFMKGLVGGARYANPQRRACGDIDFVVEEGDFLKTLDALEKIGTVDRGLVHEHHGMAIVDDVQLEPHYKVHNFQSPHVDNAIKGLFREVFPKQLVYEDVNSESIPTFPPTFECIVLVGHMVNHVYAEGLGLRQVMDFYWFLKKKHDAINWEECYSYLSEMRMERAFRIFACICEQYLGLHSTVLSLSYTDKEKRFAGELMDDILTVGNFGRGVDYLGTDETLRPLKSYLWVTRRCIKLGYLCPEEAKWWPVSKVRRFWRKKICQKL